MAIQQNQRVVSQSMDGYVSASGINYGSLCESRDLASSIVQTQYTVFLFYMDRVTYSTTIAIGDGTWKRVWEFVTLSTVTGPSDPNSEHRSIHPLLGSRAHFVTLTGFYDVSLVLWCGPCFTPLFLFASASLVHLLCIAVIPYNCEVEPQHTRPVNARLFHFPC
ncbi:hypothetical protein VNO77_24831 [Canavalia gladiata]|uniref:Uncharacterized protein n=1 Tax=Canavalia gladiata TaxID=3824 RepID=A0AAN9QGM1_CANGL